MQVTNPIPNAETLPRRELARILFQERYLAAFRERLPRYPYATDDPRQGMRPRRKERALEHLYIQVGRYPHAIFRIVLDLDEPTWWDAMDPIPPTLIVPNPREPWKAHIIYELDPPIWLSSPEAHESPANPFALVREVDALLRAYFGADPAYNGLLGRNPVVHPHLIGGGKLWDLPASWRSLGTSPQGGGPWPTWTPQLTGATAPCLTTCGPSPTAWWPCTGGS